MKEEVLKIENLIFKLEKVKEIDNKTEYIRNQYDIVIKTLKDAIHIINNEPTQYILIK